VGAPGLNRLAGSDGIFERISELKRLQGKGQLAFAQVLMERARQCEGAGQSSIGQIVGEIEKRLPPDD
jgi:hypothetical protein